MELPQHVKDFKAHLEKTKDHRFNIMRTLTEIKDPADKDDYEKMWKSVFKAESKCGYTDNKEWVSFFLNAVITAMEEKPYFSMNGETRKKYLVDIKRHTKELKRFYLKLGLDDPFLIYDPQNFHLFDENGNANTELYFLPTVGITDALDFYQDYAHEEVGGYVSKGKIGKRYKSAQFIRVLAQRNIKRYGQSLSTVLKNAALVIYGDSYNDQDISKLLRNKKTKNK